MKTEVLAIAAALIGMTGMASATTPASPQQILCQNETLVFGTVYGGHTHDCRSADPFCWARDVVGVNVIVDETVPPFRENLTGHVIQIAIRTHNDLPRDADPEAVRWNNAVPGMLGLPGTGRFVSDIDAGKLVGTEFAFALSRRDYRDMGVPEPYFAAAYSMKDEAWIRATWPGEECTRWRQNP
jgi:hypothetical protein